MNSISFISSQMNREQYREEAEYIIYLLHERRLYAWCLQQFGEVDAAEAYQAAGKLYRYRPFGDAERESIFEEEAWYRAMRGLFGAGYGEERPLLAHPNTAYRRESDRIFGYE